MSYNVICAYTAQPNTPESDAMSRVPHVVEYTEQGEKKKVTIMAECPVDAMAKVSARLRSKYKGVAV